MIINQIIIILIFNKMFYYIVKIILFYDIMNQCNEESIFDIMNLIRIIMLFCYQIDLFYYDNED